MNILYYWLTKNQVRIRIWAQNIVHGYSTLLVDIRYALITMPLYLEDLFVETSLVKQVYSLQMKTICFNENIQGSLLKGDRNGLRVH